MKKYLIYFLFVFCVGCSTTTSKSEYQATVPIGAENILSKADRLIHAYQESDSKTWSSLVCLAKTKEDVFGLASYRALFKNISQVRLISLSATTEAGNSGGQFELPKAIFEVLAEGYPVGKMLMTFLESQKEQCVIFLY